MSAEGETGGGRGASGDGRREPDQGDQPPTAPAPPEPSEPNAAYERRQIVARLAGEFFRATASATALLRGFAAFEEPTVRSAVAPRDEHAREEQHERAWWAEPPYRVEDDRLVVVDQSGLPWSVTERLCTSAADVSDLIRQHAVDGGPLLGQLAAWGIALAAHRLRDTTPLVWPGMIAGAARSLTEARPSSGYVRAAVGRMVLRCDALRASTPGRLGPSIADALIAEAEGIATETAAGMIRVADRLASAVQPASSSSVAILTPGDHGHLGVGNATGTLGLAKALARRGVAVHVFVAEGRPQLHGSRITAWELEQDEVPCTVVVDAAVGRLLAERRVDGVVLAVDAIDASGDVVAGIGSFPMALLASVQGVPVTAWALEMARDQRGTGMAGTAQEFGVTAVESAAPGEVLDVPGRRVSPQGAAAFTPLTEVVPGQLLSAVVTDAE